MLKNPRPEQLFEASRLSTSRSFLQSKKTVRFLNPPKKELNKLELWKMILLSFSFLAENFGAKNSLRNPFVTFFFRRFLGMRSPVSGHQRNRPRDIGPNAREGCDGAEISTAHDGKP